MKWTYSIPRKLRTSLLLTGVLALVLFNNLRERSNSKQLETAFESMYADRLMAESYILRLADELHQIQELLESQPRLELGKLKGKLAEIDQINLLYLNTKLTEAEELHFVHFEKLTWDLSQALNSGKMATADGLIETALKDLRLLSEIQVTEAQSILAETQRIFQSGLVISQFEIGLLIVIGLMIQGILFASKTLQVRHSQVSPNLN